MDTVDRTSKISITYPTKRPELVDKKLVDLQESNFSLLNCNFPIYKPDNFISF